MNLINEAGLYESSDLPETQKDRLRVSGKDLIIGVDYDKIDATYPSNTEELFTYSLSAATVLTIKVTYTNSSKTDLLTVESI